MCKATDLYRNDKESQAESAKCPEASWLALATQAVCGHAGALEQPSAPDKHISTQTYRKNSAPPLSHLHNAKPTPISTTNSYPPSHKKLLNFDATS